MKKFSRTIFFLIIVLVLFLGLAPRILFFSQVQERITNQLGRSLGGPLTIAEMHWVWLPLPHLTLVNAGISRTGYSVTLPRVNIYPSWRLIFGQAAKPGWILLDRPEIRIHKTTFRSGDTDRNGFSGAGFTEIPCRIKNGRLEIEVSGEYEDVFQTTALHFSDIRGSLNLRPDALEAELNGSAPFSPNINLQGVFNLTDKTYRFSLDSRNLELHKSVKSFFRGRVIPVESTARLSGTVTGTGMQRIDGNLHGTLPCFEVKPGDREVLLTCGYADLRLRKSGSELRLDINDLEIKDPQVNLSGYLERKPATGKSNDPGTAAVPIWTLDLVGTDLDLTAIRQKILILWPGNRIATRVCNIVRGGKAQSAAYRFSGPAEDFKKLSAMLIEADVLQADIHVPGAELDLAGASGPILIKDSVLSGHNLSARLGKSHGRNAELLLDLGRHDYGFKLDIDIDADLQDLMPVLRRLVKHDGFQRELARFGAVEGRAAGNLQLGDSLKKINTRVKVKKMALEARYDPIPELIVIDHGTLDILPDSVSWQKTSGRIGSQKIRSVSGRVSWQSGEPFLNLSEADALLDGAPLFAMLRQTEVLPSSIRGKLSSLAGAFSIDRGSVEGPAFSPRAWQYDIGLTAKDLTFTSPLLPEAARAENLTGAITHEKADFATATLHFLEQTFSLKGSLRHQHLEKWHGRLEFNGTVKDKLAGWLRSREWLPRTFSPRVPFTVRDLVINFQEDKTEIAGSIFEGSAGGKLSMARIDFFNTPERLRINELAFYTPGEQGRLIFDFWRRSPKKFTLTWEGFVNAETIDALFEHSPLATGSFSGDLEIQYFADQPEKSRFVGLLKTQNLHLKTKQDEEPILITNLDLTGIGRQLTFQDLNIAIGPEKLAGSGQIMAEKEVLLLDIGLNSALLSKPSLTRLAQAVQESLKVLRPRPEQQSGLRLPRDWNITGRIGFDFDSYILRRSTNLPYDGTKSIIYNFQDVHGDVQLAPDRISRTEIFSARLCDLDFSGSWFSNPDLGGKFHFSTPTDETRRLEMVLPCLGVQQDIIEGEFSLQASLLKESATWYGGSIYLKSTQGRILRLQTLSRIFRVVNITDLFEEQLGNDDQRGFPFSQMDLDAHIEDNRLMVDRAIIRGEGLNLFARGEVNLVDYNADLSLLIAPFKTFDAIISKVPIIGKPVMGEYGSRVNIPVAVKGPITEPTITPLHPEAVGEAFLGIVRDAFMLPYNIILRPLEQTGENNGR